MSYPFIVQGNNITVVIGNQPHTISKTHITYNAVLTAIKAGDWATVKDIIEPRKAVVSFGKGNVSIVGETLYWKGTELHSALSVRMIQMLQEGFSLDPMIAFMDNLMSNPSKRSVTELYGFLEKNNLPITPDGHFLAYKKVRANYFDCHSGTMDNSVGKVVEMARNAVDDDKDRTCSTGLHFCSESYLSHFGGERVVIVKINPRDVVSIPSDYNDAKGRACRYEVVGEVPVTETSTSFTSVVQSNATNNFAPKPVAQKPSGPKSGTSDFYRGYTQGYTEGYNPEVFDFDEENDDFCEGYDKGFYDSGTGLPARYVYTGAPKLRRPVTLKVKQGSSDFYRGYTDGFNSENVVGTYRPGKMNNVDYDQGYSKGESDAQSKLQPRYEYVSPLAAKAATTVATGAWPRAVRKS